MVYSATPPATTSPAPTPEPDHPGAVGALHPRRLQRRRRGHGQHGAGEHRRRHPQGVRRRARPRPSSWRRTPTPTRTPRPPTTSASPSTAPRAVRSAPTAQAVKYGQTTPSPTAVPDLLPDEPGGYNGYQALFGHRYVAPQLGAGTPNLTHNGYEVTNAAGNLVDLNGNEIDGAYLTQLPGLPWLRRHQRLPDAGLHGRHAGGRRAGHLRLHLRHPRQRAHPGPRRRARTPPDALGSGSRLLRRPGAVLQPGVRDVLPAPGRRRHHAGEHAVRLQLRRGRPRGRRQRRPGDPADAGQLRRRHRVGDDRDPRRRLHLPAGLVRRARRQPHGAAGDRDGRHDAVSAWRTTPRRSST